MSTANFRYTAQFFLSIERTITRERLKRYLSAVQQDMAKALELYECNVALSEVLYGYLHGLEVAVRNAMDHALTKGTGSPRWYDNFQPGYHRDKVQDAKNKAGKHASPGKVIAELTFGFWTDLTGQKFHQLLWMPHVRHAFPNTPLHRIRIHDRLQTIRWLRNRIAHHEPILTSQNRIYAGHQRYIRPAELAECAEWICADTAQWLTTQSRYNQANAILSLTLTRWA